MWGCGVRRESLLEVAFQSRPEGGEGTAWGWGRIQRRAGEEVGGCRKDPAFTLRGSGRALPRTAQGHSPGHSHLEEQEIHLLLERRPWSPSISKDKQASCRREERRACTLTVQRPHLRACAGYEPGSRQPSPPDPRPEGTPSPDPPWRARHPSVGSLVARLEDQAPNSRVTLFWTPAPPFSSLDHFMALLVSIAK